MEQIEVKAPAKFDSNKEAIVNALNDTFVTAFNDLSKMFSENGVVKNIADVKLLATKITFAVLADAFSEVKAIRESELEEELRSITKAN